MIIFAHPIFLLVKKNEWHESWVMALKKKKRNVHSYSKKSSDVISLLQQLKKCIVIYLFIYFSDVTIKL